MPEQYANDAATSLAAAMASTDTTLTVSSAAGFPASGNFRVRIDNEILLVTAVAGATWTVTRAVEAVAGVQAAVAHAAAATVTHVLTAASVQLAAASANPAASVGLTAVNGTATTYMTSDSAPALSQAIVPTWTGLHNFQRGANLFRFSALPNGSGNNSYDTLCVVTTAGSDSLQWVDSHGDPYGAHYSAGPIGSGYLLKSAGNYLVTTAVAGLDYGTGTVSSVGLSMPSQFAVSGSPVTGSGTLAVTWGNEATNSVFAGPSSGAAGGPLFRALVAADLPSTVAYLNATQTFTAAQTFAGNAPSAPGSGSNSEQWGNGATTNGANSAVAIGAGAYVSCNAGTAIGQGASAQGSGQATAIGQGASATGNNALAIGSDATVSADNAIAIGGGASVSKRGIAVGDVTVSNNGAAIGLNAATVQDGDLVYFWDRGNSSTSGFLLQCKTSTNTLRNFFYLGSTFVNSTDATYTCRATLNVYDYAALREGIRVESDGTEARLGFFGNTATVQPSTTAGHGATAGSTYTSNEQKMLNDVFAALEALGLMG